MLNQWCLGAGLVAGVLAATPAFATYSVAGVDPATQQVGGAGTSCVGNFSVSVIYASVPGVGALMAQAYYNQAGRDRARELLAQGLAPAEIIAQVTAPHFDGDAQRRQYGVINLTGQAAAFTGQNTGPWAGHLTGPTFTLQGNILTGEAVLRQAEAAWGQGCDLADRLMRALEAGGAGGQGDSRCTPRGIPSDGAFLQVDRPNEPAGAWLRLRVDNTAPNNPLVLLRNQYDAWRRQNPCPVPVDAGLPDQGAEPDATLFDARDATESDANTLALDATENVADASLLDAADAGAETQVRVRITDAKVKVDCGCNQLGQVTGLIWAVGHRRRRRSVTGA